MEDHHLGSRLRRGRPKPWTAGRKGQARAGRRSQGDACPGATPPPRPAQLGPLREERWAPPGPSRSQSATRPPRGLLLVWPKPGGARSRPLGRTPRRSELGKSGACWDAGGGGQRPEVDPLPLPSFQKLVHRPLRAEDTRPAKSPGRGTGLLPARGTVRWGFRFLLCPRRPWISRPSSAHWRSLEEGPGRLKSSRLDPEP